jgi:large subunit ribosomal protein L15
MEKNHKMSQMNLENHIIKFNSLNNNKKNRKRVGRGIGSRGRKCGAGDKGQAARSGVSLERQHRKFIRRFPKRGFISNVDKFKGVSILSLAKSEKTVFDLTNQRVKLIGVIELEKSIHVKVHQISATCKNCIIKAGGSVELIAKNI